MKRRLCNVNVKRKRKPNWKQRGQLYPPAPASQTAPLQFAQRHQTARNPLSAPPELVHPDFSLPAASPLGGTEKKLRSCSKAVGPLPLQHQASTSLLKKLSYPREQQVTSLLRAVELQTARPQAEVDQRLPQTLAIAVTLPRNPQPNGVQALDKRVWVVMGLQPMAPFPDSWVV